MQSDTQGIFALTTKENKKTETASLIIMRKSAILKFPNKFVSMNHFIDYLPTTHNMVMDSKRVT
jgi:hypothetical protein